MPKIADKLDALAERLQQDIDHGRRELAQNPTPKRMREYHSRVLDAANWERCSGPCGRWPRCAAVVPSRPSWPA